MQVESPHWNESPVVRGLAIGLAVVVVMVAFARVTRPAVKPQSPDAVSAAPPKVINNGPPNVLREVFHDGGIAAFNKDLHADAERLLRNAVEAGDAVCAEDDLQGVSLNFLGRALGEQGKHDDAVAVLQRAVTMREKIHGPTSRAVAVSMNNLATSYKGLKRDAEAEVLYLKSIAMLDALNAAHQQDLAVACANLRTLYWRTKRFDEVKPLLERELTIYEKLHGSEHKIVADTCHSLAMLHEVKGARATAKEFYQRALTIFEKTDGMDSVPVSDVCHNLADLHKKQREYTNAEQLFMRAFSIREAKYDPDHAKFNATLDQLVSVYEEQKDVAKVEALMVRVLAICEKKSWKYQKRIMGISERLARELSSHDPAKAIPYALQVAIARKVLPGKEDDDFDRAVSTLISICEKANNWQQAEGFLKGTLVELAQELGDEHKLVDQRLDQLAKLYLRTKKFSQATAALEQLRSIRERTFGPVTEEVARTCRLIGNAYFEADRLERAELAYQRALEIFEAIDEKALASRPKSQIVAEFSLPEDPSWNWNATDIRLRLAQTWIRLKKSENAESVVYKAVHDCTNGMFYRVSSIIWYDSPMVWDESVNKDQYHVTPVSSVLTGLGDQFMLEGKFSCAAQAFCMASQLDKQNIDIQAKLLEAIRQQTSDETTKDPSDSSHFEGK